MALFVTVAALLPVNAQTWDSSGNGMLTGTYYFRETLYFPYDAYGDLSEGTAVYGNITFDGKGNYKLTSAIYYDSSGSGAQLPSTTSGTYVISASGYGYISPPLQSLSSSSLGYIYGLVSQSGIFIGSATETYNDLLIAAPVGSSPANAGTFKGSYTVADMDFPVLVGFGAPYPPPYYTLGAMLTWNPDGSGNLPAFTVTGYLGGNGSTATPQSVAAVKYTFQNGAGVLPLPNTSNGLIAGTKYVYISPDGNFVFGGSPTGWDMFVGVRTGSGTPAFSGLYYQAGIDQDSSTLPTANGGYATQDTYYGSLSALGGPVVAHERMLYNAPSANSLNVDGYTFSDTFGPATNGAYANSLMKYAVSADGTIRIGSGIGPELGISVALAAPSVTGPGSGVYIYPQYVLNAASYAPFTAGVSPGEVVTLAGLNLAASPQVATSPPFPTTLGGVQVMVNSIAAPLISVSSTQVSFLVPYEVTSSLAGIQVVNSGTNGGTSNTVTLPVNMTTPGLFTFQQNGIGSVAALHQNYSFVNSSNPAQPGEIIQVYLTGLGTVTPSIADGAAGPSSTFSNTTNTITAYINGETATVGYAGLAPTLGGLYQLNVTVPTDLTTGTYYLDISGPDSYTSEATVAVGAAASASDRPATAIRKLRRHR